MRKPIIIIIALFVCQTMTIMAQISEKDTLTQQIRSYAARNFPTTRTVDFYWETSLANDYKLKQDGKVLEKGKIRDSHILRLTATVPVLTVNKFSLYANGQFNSYQFNAKLDDKSQSPIFKNVESGYNYYAGGLTAMHHMKIKNKPVILTASVTGDGWDKGFGMLGATVSAVVQFRNTPTSRFSAGMTGMTLFRGIPVMPVIMYWKQINPDWTFELTMPSKIYFRYQPNDSHRLSLGASMESDNFYIKPGVEDVPEMCFYSKTSIKTGFVYEYIINKHFYFSASAGASLVVGGGLYKKNRKGIKVVDEDGRVKEDPYVKIKQPVMPYVKLGISYNIF